MLSTGGLSSVDRKQSLYMKKEYITPQIVALNFVSELLLSTSVVEKESIGVVEEFGTDDDFNTNRRKGWANFWEDSSPFN